MNLTKFTRSLLLALLVAVLAVGAGGLLPSSAAFVQCNPTGNAPNGPTTNPEVCGTTTPTDDVGTTDDDFVNGSDDPDAIDTSGDADDNPDPFGPDNAGAGGDDTVIANGGTDGVRTGDGDDTVFGGNADTGNGVENDNICTNDGNDNVFPGGSPNNDDNPNANPEDILPANTSCGDPGASINGVVTGTPTPSVSTGPGDDKVWINAGEVTGVLTVDCGAGNDSVNFVGFGENITSEEQTKSRQVDPTTGGVIFTIDCENLNGLAAGN